jgi:hypothetical protein
VEGAMESIKASSTYFQIISRDYKVGHPSKQNEKNISHVVVFAQEFRDKS